MSTQLYSIVSDFGEAPNSNKLQNEIIESAISSSLLSIDRRGDEVFIRFSTELSVGDKTLLDSLVAGHTNTTTLTETATIQLATATPRTERFNSVVNKRCATMEYAGTSQTLPIKFFSCFAYKDSSVSNYTISIFDIKNKVYLTSETFTNDTEDIVYLDTISNLPKNLTTLEVQVKKQGGNSKQYMYIDKVTAWG